MAGISSLLGKEVVAKNGDKVATSTFEAPGKVIGLYFSAHWCPPCRAFTPQLADFYKKFKETEKGSNLEMVFVSSDRDEEQFNEYFGEMPWHALPYSERDLKAKLSKTFKVQGIPMLVFVEGDTCKVITHDGRSSVMDDLEGTNFPWYPKSLAEILQGGQVVKGDGSKLDLQESVKGKIKAFYFSAHWCPPCKAFTPVLVSVYKKLQAAGKAFEVVFVSSDRGQEPFDEYFSTMPWLALPHGDERCKELSKHFEVDGIPFLVVLDEEDAVITKDGRGQVAADTEGKDFPWHPKPLDLLTDNSVGVVNSQPCLLYLSTDGGEEERAQELLKELAEADVARQKADSSLGELAFLYEGAETGDVADSIRTFARCGEASPLVIILDITEQCKYVLDGEPSEDSIKTFIADFRAGKLKGQKLQR